MPGRRRDWKSPVPAPDTGEFLVASFRLWITEGGVHYEACPLWSFLTGCLALLPSAHHKRRRLFEHARTVRRRFQIRRGRWLTGRRG